MNKAMQMLRDAGYNAYIEHGRLYYRTHAGGIEGVINDAHVTQLVEQAYKSLDVNIG